MSNDNKPKDNVELLLELAKLNGVAVTSVSDGHVLVFTKASLENFLKECNDAGQEQVVVFVKRGEATKPGLMS
jgi:hypothetical protein